MNINLVKAAKIAGVALTVGSEIVSAWVRDKQMDATISKKIAEALKK